MKTRFFVSFQMKQIESETKINESVDKLRVRRAEVRQVPG